MPRGEDVRRNTSGERHSTTSRESTMWTRT
jgi:hypothetical protein